VIVATEVEPRQERERDDEVAVQVEEVRDLDEPALVIEQRLLEARLEEGAEPALGVHDPLGVRVRQVLAAVREPADDLIAVVCGEEQQELPGRIEHPPGKEAENSRSDATHECRGSVNGR
jgi:hypothetical protein